MSPKTSLWKDAMLGCMWSERWLGRWRSRSVLLWAATSVIVFLVSGILSANGQCEYFVHDDGTEVPINYPWHPATTAGRRFVMMLISVMSITNVISGALVLLLLVGSLWAHVLRDAWPLCLLLLVPALALLLQLPVMVVHFVGPEFESRPPLFVELAWAAEFWSRPFTKASLLLVGTGLLAVGLRTCLNRRVKPTQS